MKPGRALLGLSDGLIDRLLCVLGVLVFSQGPEFIQQYLQRLGGHLDEARRQLAQFRDVAAQSGLTLDRLIAQTSANADTAVANLGGVMSASVERVAELESAQAAIQNASIWSKPFVFLRHVDPSIAQATWDIYRPAVPTTAEGIVYALLGMFVFLSLYHGLIRFPITRAARLRRASSPLADAPSASPVSNLKS